MRVIRSENHYAIDMEPWGDMFYWPSYQYNQVPNRFYDAKYRYNHPMGTYIYLSVE